MLVLELKAPPFSVNKSHYRNGNRTMACRLWGDDILDQLKKYKEEIKEFRSSIAPSDINRLAFALSITFFIPIDIYFTKTGKISRASNDLTNVEKMLVDLIFDNRFFVRGHFNLNIDDCLIDELHSFKKPSPTGEYSILVEISKKFNDSLL